MLRATSSSTLRATSRSSAGLRGLATAPVATPATDFEAYFAGVQQECRGELAAYGACIGRSLEALNRGVCAPEFAALRACSDASLARARSAKAAAAAK